jgi:MarR family transcriptional regulator, organic hydroperoxide resistance regulator
VTIIVKEYFMDNENFFELIRRLREKCREREDRVMQKYLLSPAEFDALLSLQSRERVTCRELSSRMNLSVSRGSRIIDKLFSHGLIERTDLDSDRRCKNVWLTSKGEEVRQGISGEMAVCEERLAASCSAAELRALKASLHKITESF